MSEDVLILYQRFVHYLTLFPGPSPIYVLWFVFSIIHRSRRVVRNGKSKTQVDVGWT